MLELELAVLEEGLGHSGGGDVQLQLGYDLQVQLDADEALTRPQHHLDVVCNLPQGSLLQPALHHPGTGCIVSHRQRHLQQPALIRTPPAQLKVLTQHTAAW